jgi:hypothetical protein
METDVGIESLLTSAQGEATIRNLASAFGLDPAQAQSAAASLGEALSQRIQRNTLSRGGIADVVGLLGDATAARAANDPQGLAGPDVAGAGNGVLDVLIGDKHISRGIAARTAAATGVSEDVAKKMLPVVASLLIGGLQSKAQPELDKLMRNVPALALSRNGSPLPLPGEVPMDNRPEADDTEATVPVQPPARPAPPRPARPISGGSPLPIPGDSIPGVGRDAPNDNPDNPYDRLPDIIRRGGVQIPGGGSLENVIRSILGGLLGFGNRGVIGTILQMLLIRFLPGILKSIFSRA